MVYNKPPYSRPPPLTCFFSIGTSLSANNFLFADTVSANNFLFADTVSANNFLFEDTLSANNLFLQGLWISEIKIGQNNSRKKENNR